MLDAIAMCIACRALNGAGSAHLKLLKCQYHSKMDVDKDHLAVTLVVTFCPGLAALVSSISHLQQKS